MFRLFDRRTEPLDRRRLPEEHFGQVPRSRNRPRIDPRQTSPGKAYILNSRKIKRTYI
jgi:hypothetical protein